MIGKHRRIPIETNSEATFQTWIGENGSYKQVIGSTVPASWQDAAQTLTLSRGLVIVLGDVDSGKSTLCAYLANTTLHHNLHSSIIDGDVGQADIGPPTTVSSSTISKHIFSLQELRPERSYFVGDTSPSTVPDKHVHSILRLKDKLSEENDITILNTDGWLRENQAIDHKLELLESLRPGLVLGLGPDPQLDKILEVQQYPSRRLEASKHVLTRTREQRKKSREEAYRRFLQNSRSINLRLNKIELRAFKTPRQERIDQKASHRGTLAGLLDNEGALLSIGRIERIEAGLARVTTPLTEMPRIIELGAVVLSSAFNEVGFES